MAGENKDFEITRDGDQDGAQSVFGETAGTPEQEAMYARFQERFGAQKEAARAALRLMSEAEMAKLRADVAAGREQEAAQAVAAKFLEYYVLDFAQLEKEFSAACLEAKLDKVEKSGEFAPSLCSSLLKVLSRRGYAVALDAGKPVVEAKADAKPAAAEVQAALSRRAAASSAFSDALRRGLVFQTTASAEASDKPAKTSEVAAGLRKKYGLEKDADFTADNVRAKVSDAGDRAFLLSYRATPGFGVQDALEKSSEQARKAAELLAASFPQLQPSAGAKAEGALASIARDPFTATIQFMNRGPFTALGVMALLVVALFKNWKGTLLAIAGLGVAKELGGLDKLADFFGSDQAKELARKGKEKAAELPDRARAAYGKISERLQGKVTPEESQKFHLDLTDSADFGGKTVGQLHAALAKGGDLRAFFGDVGSVAGTTGAAYYEANKAQLKKYLSALDKEGYSPERRDDALSQVLGGSLPETEEAQDGPEASADPAVEGSGESRESGPFAPGSYVAFDDGRPTLFTRDGKRSRIDANTLSPEAREGVRSQADLSLFLETYQVWREGVQRMASGLMLKPLRGAPKAIADNLRQVDDAVSQLYASATAAPRPSAEQLRAKVRDLVGLMKRSDRVAWTDEAFDDAKYAEIEKVLTSDGDYEPRLLALMRAMRQGVASDGDSQAVRDAVSHYLLHSNRAAFKKAREALENPAAYATVKDSRPSEWAKLGIPDAVAKEANAFQKKLQAESSAQRSLDAARAKILAANPEISATDLDAGVTRLLEEGARIATMRFLQGALADEVIDKDPSVSGDEFVKLAKSAGTDVSVANALNMGMDLAVLALSFVPAGWAVRGVAWGARAVEASAWARGVAAAANEGGKAAKAAALLGSGARIGAEGVAFYEAQSLVSGILYREGFSEIGSDMADGVGMAKSVAFMGVMAAVTKYAGPALSELGAVKRWSPKMSKEFVAQQLIPRAGLIAAEGAAVTAATGVIDVAFDQPKEWTMSEFVQGMALVAMMRGMTPAAKWKESQAPAVGLAGNAVAGAARYELYKKDGKPAVREASPRAAAPAELRARMEKELADLKAGLDETLSPAEISVRRRKIAELEARLAAPGSAADAAYGLGEDARQNAVVRTLKGFAADASASELNLGNGLKATKDAQGRVVIGDKVYDKDLDRNFAEFARKELSAPTLEPKFEAFARAQMERVSAEAPANVYRMAKQGLLGKARFETADGVKFVVELERTQANPKGELRARELSADGKPNGALRALTDADKSALMGRFAERFSAELEGGFWSGMRKRFVEVGLLDPRNRDLMAEARAKEGVMAAAKKFGAVLLTGKADPSLLRKWVAGSAAVLAAGYSTYRGATRDDATVVGENLQNAFDYAGLSLLGVVGLVPAMAYDAVK